MTIDAIILNDNFFELVVDKGLEGVLVVVGLVDTEVDVGVEGEVQVLSYEIAMMFSSVVALLCQRVNSCLPASTTKTAEVRKLAPRIGKWFRLDPSRSYIGTSANELFLMYCWPFSLMA